MKNSVILLIAIVCVIVIGYLYAMRSSTPPMEGTAAAPVAQPMAAPEPAMAPSPTMDGGANQVTESPEAQNNGAIPNALNNAADAVENAAGQVEDAIKSGDAPAMAPAGTPETPAESGANPAAPSQPATMN